MSSFQRRSTTSPCIICLETFEDNKDIIFCPECGEPYHKHCWKKKGQRCAKRGCFGREYILWPKIEARVLKLLRIEKTKLSSICTNCSARISPLDRFCRICGFDINRPEKQRTFWAYSLVRSFRGYRRTAYLLILVIGLFLLYISTIAAIGVLQKAEEKITEALRDIFVQKTTPSPPTSTAVVVRSTSTATLIPTRLPTKVILSDPSLCVKISNVSVRDTSKGDVLSILCSNDVVYDFDPLAKGEYEIAPNGNFIVYVTMDGYVYVARVGNKHWRKIGQFTEFRILEISGVPKLDVSIYGNDPYYVRVYEENGNERKNFPIPEEISD